MVEFLIDWAEATWLMLVDSAFYFLVGLILAGLIWLFLNEKNLTRLLGRSRSQAVIRAALIGVPLPLCSCSVLPVASQLRKSGLSRGGTVSFLIATPESSVDSILLTYSLTDPLLTVARPIAAFVTAAAAGFSENVFDREGIEPASRPVSACKDGCGCEEEAPAQFQGGLLSRIWGGQKHSFGTLMSDLAPYLFWGYLLAGLAAAILGSPLNFAPGNGWWPYLIALVVGVPLYVCATSSTPLAAVLLGAGFPPGAILVFLMVGPATNLTTLAVTRKILGLWSTARYLASIVFVSVLCGLALDWLYPRLGLQPAYETRDMNHGHSWLYLLSAGILSGLILWYVLGRLLKRKTG